MNTKIFMYYPTVSYDAVLECLGGIFELDIKIYMFFAHLTNKVLKLLLNRNTYSIFSPATINFNKEVFLRESP